MIYKGANPEFEEFGPYYYREYDIYEDVVYGNQADIPGETQ